MKKWIILCCLISLLVGCGQSGKLYLPEQTPAKTTEKKSEK